MKIAGWKERAGTECDSAFDVTRRDVFTMSVAELFFCHPSMRNVSQVRIP